MSTIDTDILVLGSGLSGLAAALESPPEADVLVVTKRARSEANTRYAQGGISSVLGNDDTFADHARDTQIAGAGLCKPTIVDLCVSRGPEAIRALIGWGVEFSKGDSGGSGFDLGREGGHTRRRVAHAGDITGAEVEKALLATCDARPNIRFLEDHAAIDLITRQKHLKSGGHNRCHGAYVLDAKAREVITVRARRVILATGGGGKLYRYTSNPDVATGDGVAMGYRAGARVANMEFFQFHPTCLFHPDANNFLISEALRGEGGILRTCDGESFMEGYHEMGSLAPRDIVARAIDAELKKSGDNHVVLDMTHLDSDFLLERFPNIHERCVSLGLDMRTTPLPVVPAAHYMCGGVVTDAHARARCVEGLYAVGEVACTGLHGANRLASNSLLEAAVFARLATEDIARDLDRTEAYPDVPGWDLGEAREPDEVVIITQNWREIRQFMWNYVGIVRSDRRLARARRRVGVLREEIHEYYWNYRVHTDLLELRNLALLAELTIRCATLRKESRGLHYTVDYPSRSDARFGTDTVLEGL